jgi:hypothetical protein
MSIDGQRHGVSLRSRLTVTDREAAEVCEAYILSQSLIFQLVLDLLLLGLG